MSYKKENYVIGIPSYNREENIKKATINLLTENDIDPRIVYIFVATNEEKQKYIKSLKNTPYKIMHSTETASIQPGNINRYKGISKGTHIVVGELGVKNIRNCMANFFNEGEYIFYLDDDVYNLYECVFDEESIKKVARKLNIKSLQPNEINLKKHIKDGYRLIEIHTGSDVGTLNDFILKGFTKCEELNHRLFGINPVDNPYFLTPEHIPIYRGGSHISTDLRYIIGYGCGVINCKDAEVRTVHDKEDYERSIKYYLSDGGTIRYNNICAKTKCYKEPGGLQSTGHRTWEKVDKSAKFLVEAYPELTKLNTRKKSADSKTGKSWTEVRLHDYRKGNKKIFGNLPKIPSNLYSKLNEIDYGSEPIMNNVKNGGGSYEYYY